LQRLIQPCYSVYLFFIIKPAIMKKSVAVLLSFLSIHILQSQETRLLRDPDISDSKIVFAYANDLWTVDKAGGTAQRLTSFPGTESNPKFSAMEKQSLLPANTRQHRCVYNTCCGGGPKRLTWHPGADIVCGWSPRWESCF
jgi:tricorn protease